MTKEEARNPIYRTLGAASFMVLVLGMPHAAFMLKLVAVPLAAWLLYSFCAMLIMPQRKALHLARIAIWVTAVFLIVGIHVMLYETTRSDANELVDEIKRFNAEHGHYPETLDELGISAQAFHDRLGYAWYGLRDGKPRFFYAVTYEIFTQYAYNFDSDSWKYVPD